MSAPRGERIQEAIVDQATYWFVLHRDGGLTAAQQEEFLRWLRASLQHTGEYLAVARLCGGMRAAIADIGIDAEDLLKQHRQGADEVIALNAVHPSRPQGRRRNPVWRRAGLLGLAATVLAAAGLYWWTAPGFAGLPRTVAAAHGEQRTVTLHDGSIMHVNVSSRVKVRFSGAERLIELDSGQAMFEVARDPTRPFRVVAGTAEVVAVGTQFDVYRRDSRVVTVTVVQGKVDVVDRHDGDVPGQTPNRRRLNAGEQIRLGAQIHAAKVDTRASTAWVRREIMFEGQPLGEVAREFNRYIPVPIEIEEPALQTLLVSGVFNAYDTDSFITFLKQYPVRVHRDGRYIRVSREKIPD